MTSKEYYRKLLVLPFSYSVRYFLKLIFLVSVLSAIIALTGIQDVQRGLDSLKETFPEDLVLVVSRGEVVVNVPEPVIIPAPIDVQYDGVENFIVIDTSQEVSLRSIDEFNTMLFISKDTLVIQEDAGGVRTMSLADFPDMVVDRDFIDKNFERMKKASFVVIPGLSFGAFFLGTFILGVVVLIIIALGVRMIFHLRLRSIGYKKAYQVSIHALTLPLLLEVALRAFGGMTLPAFATLFLALATMFFLVEGGMRHGKVTTLSL